MTSRQQHVAPLKEPYAAYNRRETPPEDVYLTHVEPGKPCGEYFRRFWQPLAFSSEVADLPIPIKIMGEQLVLFRDRGGRLGLLQRHCSHRGTSLEFGRIEQSGIRCCYHGWLYDVDGTVLETPTEPERSTLKDKLFHGAYPVEDHHGLIFAYLGPPSRRPSFPEFDFFSLPGFRVFPAGKAYVPCNWLQNKENIMDPFHTVFLHARLSQQFSAWHARAPYISGRRTEFGAIAVASRRVDAFAWARVNEWIFPNIHQFAGDFDVVGESEQFEVEAPWETKWAVPIDSWNTMIIRLLHVNERTIEGLSDGELQAFLDSEITRANIGEELEGTYAERQRNPGDYDAQVSQRPVAVHALERLGASDRWVALARRALREEIRAVEHGEDPHLVTVGHGPIETYAHHRLVRLGSDNQEDGDRAVQLVTDGVLADPTRRIGQRVQALGEYI